MKDSISTRQTEHIQWFVELRKEVISKNENELNSV